jgi:methylase of polypeptide subunit release factors
LTETSALRALLAQLDAEGYDFVTPTPSVCRRARERDFSRTAPLRAIFGWTLPFQRRELDPALFESLVEAGVIDRFEDRFRSRVRVARLDGLLFVHSASPVEGEQAVFLGPDSYRFARFIAQATADQVVRTIAEVGCGAGVGGLVAARRHPGARLDLGDVNPLALDLASVNAAHAGVAARAHNSDGLSGLQGPYDLIVANPPYVAGVSGRLYKDGGDLYGQGLALDWARQALARLEPGGRFVLYSGSAILDGGRDILRAGLGAIAAEAALDFSYEELDPDIFGGELRRQAYAEVERIAAVGAVIRRPISSTA